MTYADEFDVLYHRILHDHVVMDMERGLLDRTVQCPLEVFAILNEFASVLDEPVLHEWMDILQELRSRFDEDRSPRERKQVRVVLRHVCRVATMNVKLHRVLDLVLHKVVVKMEEENEEEN